MRISDWSSDVCSSDLHFLRAPKLVDLAYVARDVDHQFRRIQRQLPARDLRLHGVQRARHGVDHAGLARWVAQAPVEPAPQPRPAHRRGGRSEEHTSELQSLMRISYAVFCLKKKKQTKKKIQIRHMTRICY